MEKTNENITSYKQSNNEFTINNNKDNNNHNNRNTKNNIKNNTSITSIVISGWPAVGKTTMASEIAKEFNLKLYNGGDILKMLARERGYSVSRNDWWDTEEAKRFMADRKSDPNFDKQVDNKLVEIVKKENAVITSYTLPWLVDGPIKFWLKGSQLNRAKRMANRDNLSIEEAQTVVKLRDEENKAIYRRLYQFEFGQDLTVFDFSINTDLMCLGSLVKVSISILKNIMANS
ncbi:MAG TPA: cytidylate kinase family protein [Nitrososphaeraceae archaeon]|nr:cytidylate kinase family protein [Nitrososphaeraceae archaeon]